MLNSYCSEFTSDSRLLLIAPHPDDEALAASVVLQRAVEAGAAVRVLYATDGDDNPWPQRLLEKKWRLDANDRQRWGQLRRAEALAALRILGITGDQAQFLGLPDQGLTGLLLRDANEVVARLSRIILKWRPNGVLAPALCDTHPDHSALAVLVRIALLNSVVKRTLPRIRQWSYLVHGRSRVFARTASGLIATKIESARKRSAILCHRTQVRLSRRRFLGYVARPERFALMTSGQAAAGDASLRFAGRSQTALCLHLRRTVRPGFEPWTDAIWVIGIKRNGEVQSLRLNMPARSGLVTMEDGVTGKARGLAAFHGDAFAGRLFIPTELFSERESLFVKMQRRAWFFDEAGWLEMAAVTVAAGKARTSSAGRVAVTSATR